MKTLYLTIIISVATISAFGIFLFVQLQFMHGPELTYIIREILPDDEIEKDPGMVTIQNQTFHIMTIDKIAFNSNNSTEIDWYGIKFAFPNGLELTNSTHGKFIELYVTFPDESVSHKMAVAQGFVAFSTHHNPQVGILLHNETVKLLVNWSTIHSDLTIIGLNDTYKTKQPIDFQIETSGFDYFDEGQTPKIWVERQNGNQAWIPPHKDSIILCCAPELTEYYKRFNSTDLGGPIRIDKSGTYNLVISYNDQKIQKQFVVVQPTITYGEILPYSIKVENTNFTINYNITANNKILDANMDAQSKSLVLSLETTSNGTLIVILPRGLIDPKVHGQDSPFIIIGNGREMDYRQSTSSITDRMLIIPFQYGISKIEIITPGSIQ